MEDSKVLQKNSKESKRIQKNPKDSKRIQKIPKESKRFQKIPKDFKRIRKIPKDLKRFQKDSKRFQKIPEITKNSKELISKQYFTLKEPARAQKANGSYPPPKESKTKRRPSYAGASKSLILLETEGGAISFLSSSRLFECKMLFAYEFF